MYWSEASGKGVSPGARSSHALAAVGNCLYIFGGELVARTPLPAQLFCYDNAQRSWQQLNLSGEDLGPRLGHSTTAVGTDLYTFGGRTGVHFADSTLGDLFKINVDTLTCEEVHANGQAPEPRSYHAAATSGSDLYIFGGCGADGRLNDLHQYSTTSNTWRTLPPHPDIKPRGGAGLVAHNDKLFVIGGFSGKEQGDVYVFDLTKEIWSDVTGGSPLPARSVFAHGILPQGKLGADLGKLGADLGKVGGDPGKVGADLQPGSDWIVVFGGEVDPSDLGHEGAGDYADEVFGLDPCKTQLGWQKLTIKGSAPSPRAWLASTSFPSGVAIHGGNAPDNSRLDGLYVLNY